MNAWVGRSIGLGLMALTLWGSSGLAQAMTVRERYLLEQQSRHAPAKAKRHHTNHAAKPAQKVRKKAHSAQSRNTTSHRKATLQMRRAPHATHRALQQRQAKARNKVQPALKHQKANTKVQAQRHQASHVRPARTTRTKATHGKATRAKTTRNPAGRKPPGTKIRTAARKTQASQSRIPRQARAAQHPAKRLKHRSTRHGR